MISIITPAYIDTVEKIDWLHEMIKSVQEQSLKDWELIIMNDCSPLSLGVDIAEDTRIRIFKMPTRVGPSLARNTAVAIAEYDAILPVDSDDLLAGPDVLQALYNAWVQDKTRCIYGDLQQYKLGKDGKFEKGKLFELGQYSFKNTMNLKGTMPVTVLHSKECHHKAGGWKQELDAGLEDVEKWISAGKAGFCGLKIDTLTLLYRIHDTSRQADLRHSKQELAMQKKIIEMHDDVFNKEEYPMGCCGGGSRSYASVAKSKNAASTMPPTTLDQVGTNDKVWVQYMGDRQASFPMQGKFTNMTYTIDGIGFKFEAHVNDLSIFKRARRPGDGQQCFIVGCPPPDGYARPEIIEAQPKKFEAQPPDVATVERLDRRARIRFGMEATA